MKKHLFFFTLALCSTLSITAQITFTAADFPNIGETYVTIECDVNASISIGQAGANQTYDFSSLVGIDSIGNTFVDPASTPGASAFPSATIATSGLDENEGFLYLQESATEIVTLGFYVDVSEDGSGEFLASIYNPTQKIIEFPTTFNTSYTDNDALSFTVEDDSGFADSIRNTNTTVREVLFDAYGTVITPDGTYACLRERTYSSTLTSTEALVNGIWVPIQSFEFVDTSYAWYTKESKVPIVSAAIFDGEISDITYTAIEIMAVAPVASFQAEQDNDGTYLFTDLSSNLPTSWLWDFGDGNTSEQQNPQHTYDDPGEYTVCLTVTNEQGSDQTCTAIQVVFAPQANFTFTNQGSGVVDFMDASTNEPQTWAWDFGDGNGSSDQNPQHTYTTSGNFDVCLTVSNSAGSTTTCETVEVILAPIAAFTFTIQGDGLVEFLDGSTNFPENWSWDFDDNSGSDMQNPTHTYTEPGSYNVCLTVSNSAGSATICNTVEIVLAPVAAFTFTNQGAGVVDFQDASTNDPESWAWDFGDGNTDTAQNPQHTYANSDTYTVCLTVENSAGSNTLCQDVVIMITSTEHIEDLVAVQIAPNPVKDVLEIELQSQSFEQLNFQLINAQGQVISQQRLQSNQRHRVDMQSYPTGVYYFTIRNDLGQLGAKGKVIRVE